ncbi:hypothetical protein PF008_g18580 [Phytophthora fragariae]|uniref:Uncharacterized protein n=1 Tax=Phytophthora fragariae TaxID=53985 RepID=A0A6G0R578_9STRA|nr:hypothetical protein PF008_g18580 [Phytophthora fragariae]
MVASHHQSVSIAMERAATKVLGATLRGLDKTIIE